MPTRRWRCETLTRSRGPYRILRSGRGSERRAISLKYVSDAEADRALTAIRAEEAQGTAARVLRLYEDDPASAIRYLIGDPSIEQVFGPDTPNYAIWTLRRYVEEVYGPWRSADRPRTWRTEEGHWRRILPVIGARRLRDIDEFVVADYLDALLIERGARRGQPMAGSTKRLHRAAVQACIKRAYRLRHIERMPDLARFRIEGSTRRAREKPAPLLLAELLALMEASDPLHRCMWAVGAGQGLRPSELTRLRWEDVRWQSRTLFVRGEEEHGGKTRLSVAEIPLTPLAFRELQRWRTLQGTPTEGLLFTFRSKRIVNFKTALRTAAAAAGIERNIYPYLLRDSFATIAWSLDILMDAAWRVLRHTDDTMLRKVYCRPRPADLVARVAAFDFAERRDDAQPSGGTP